MPNYVGPLLATLRDILSMQFVGHVFLLLFIFGILFKLIGGRR